MECPKQNAGRMIEAIGSESAAVVSLLQTNRKVEDQKEEKSVCF